MDKYLAQCRKFYEIFEGKNSCELIENVHSELSLIGDDEHIITNKNTLDGNSYVSSLYSAFVSYPQEELDLIKSKKSRLIAKIALGFLRAVFRAINIEKSVFVGNFLISTNFFPKPFASQAEAITLVLPWKHKQEFICIRSLNEAKNSELLASLKAEGWTLLPARIVYLFDYDALDERKKKNHYKNDMKLLAKTTLECVSGGFVKEDFETMQRLFEALYIEKHSSQNPRFTAKFIRKSYESGFLEVYAYRQEGEIVAFIAILEMEGIISTPMLGYDTSLPQDMGLYRLLCAKLHTIAEERKMDINFSSGAGEFKKLRGAHPALEYTAVYAKHLSGYKWITLKILAFMIEKNIRSFFGNNNLV